jgi:hypothetical protein
MHSFDPVQLFALGEDTPLGDMRGCCFAIPSRNPNFHNLPALCPKVCPATFAVGGPGLREKTHKCNGILALRLIARVEHSAQRSCIGNTKSSKSSYLDIPVCSVLAISALQTATPQQTQRVFLCDKEVNGTSMR